MRTYNCFTVVLSISQIVLIVLIVFGEVLINKVGYLTCTEGGYQWLYESLAGEGFIFMGVVNMIVQCLLIEKFLFDVPVQHGYFKEDNDNFRAANNENEMVAANN